MNVAILHFHLNRGGVTSVMMNHIRALARAHAPVERLLVLHGGRDDGWDPAAIPAEWQNRVRSDVVAGLDYDVAAPVSSDALTSALDEVLRRHHLLSHNTLLHAHNHNLGKNLGFPGALNELARRGYCLLLQIHDFAEDFRPENYRRLLEACGHAEQLAATIYPQAPQIHYAVLNDRDHKLLAATGCDAARLHFLPNPVNEPPADTGSAAARTAGRRTLNVSDDRPLAVYPVRGIRRKNVGELLLWSAALRDTATFAITLPPQNPVEHVSYARWRSLAGDLHLPCLFDIGARDDLSFAQVLAASDRLLTTSVAEGFGMVYLDAWLAGKSLIGRDLPEITADFCRHGLRFPDLHPQVCVPWTWIGMPRMLDAFAPLYAQTLTAYGKTPPDQTSLEQSIEALVHNDSIDFAVLPTRLQQQVIQRVATNTEAHRQLLLANPWMQQVMTVHDPQLVAENAALVREHYSLLSCGHNLHRIYEHVFGSERTTQRSPPEHPSAVLDSFLSVARFRPVRTETN